MDLSTIEVWGRCGRYVLVRNSKTKTQMPALCITGTIISRGEFIEMKSCKVRMGKSKCVTSMLRKWQNKGLDGGT